MTVKVTKFEWTGWTCTGGAARSGAPAMLASLVKLNDGRMIKS